MKKDKFDEKIAEWETERDRLLEKMIAYADKHGHSFTVDYGGSNTYIPEGGKTTCSDCEGSGTYTKYTYDRPSPQYPSNYPYETYQARFEEYKRLSTERWKNRAEEETQCEVCEGTGQVETDECGWQNSYC